MLVLNHPRFSAEAVLDVLRSRPVSSLCAPPTVWRMLLRAGLGTRPAALADVMSAGEPLQAELMASVQFATWQVLEAAVNGARSLDDKAIADGMRRQAMMFETEAKKLTKSSINPPHLGCFPFLLIQMRWRPGFVLSP